MATSPRTANRRKDVDVMKLIEGKHEVRVSDFRGDLTVVFHGPEGTPYAGGFWNVRVNIPDDYPFKYPRIGFINRIFHPNIEEMSGAVCLNVISEAWTPLYGLSNIFDTFLPQLLTYPNPMDPLNSHAANLHMSSPEQYNKFVINHVRTYACSREVAENRQIQKGHAFLPLEFRNMVDEDFIPQTETQTTDATNGNANHSNSKEEEEEDEDDDDVSSLSDLSDDEKDR